MKTTLRFMLSTVVAPLALGLTACGGNVSTNPNNLQGTYTVDVTNETSTCPGTWTVGEKSSVTVDLTQSGNDVSADVDGGSGFFLKVATGSQTFTGTASGDTLNATLVGTTSQTTGNCTYTWNAALTGTLNGNALQGTITYTPNLTNSDPDCASMHVTGCSSTQNYAGVRPSN